MRLTCWHYCAEFPKCRTVILPSFFQALPLPVPQRGPLAPGPSAAVRPSFTLFLASSLGLPAAAPRPRTGRRKVEGRAAEFKCGSRRPGSGRGGRFLLTEKLKEVRAKRWRQLVLRAPSGRRWAGEWRGPTLQVLAPAGHGLHVFTRSWLPYLPAPYPRRLTQPRGPVPSARASGAEAWSALGAQVPLPRRRPASGPAPRGPGAAPAQRWEAGAVPQAQLPHPGSPESQKSGSRAGEALPELAARRAWRGPSGGGRVAPGQAQLQRAGLDRADPLSPKSREP